MYDLKIDEHMAYLVSELMTAVREEDENMIDQWLTQIRAYDHELNAHEPTN